MLKHYALIDDVLVRQLRANDFNINDDCVFDTLEEIKRETTKDVIDSYERKINLQSQQHSEEISQLKEASENEIKAKNAEHQAYKEKLLDNDMIKYQKIIKKRYYVISSLLIVIFFICSILPLILGLEWNIKSITVTACAGLLLVVDILQFALALFKNKCILNKLIERKKAKLKKKYDLL